MDHGKLGNLYQSLPVWTPPERKQRIEVSKGLSPTSLWLNFDFWISQDSILWILGTQKLKRPQDQKSEFWSNFHYPFYIIHHFWGSASSFPCSPTNFVSSFTHIEDSLTHDLTRHHLLIALQQWCIPFVLMISRLSRQPRSTQQLKWGKVFRSVTFESILRLGSSVVSPSLVAKPMPFRFASSFCRARPVASPDNDKLLK